MTLPKRHPPAELARQMRVYKPGEKVKVIRGPLAGEIRTIAQSANDWVTLKEMRSREVLSKRIIEPEEGFTEEEMNQARRAAERMGA